MNWENQLEELINLIKSASADLWRIALLQVKADLISNILFATLLLFLLTISLIIALKWLRADKDYTTAGQDTGGFASCILTIVFSFMSVGLINNIIHMLINPEFYALKLLIEMIPAK